ncbi:hypothetical protein HETIRDRAFT_167592 [Heterobasidion irregulare TC 32-1]|uniref:Uncharacterized protein n=1 Tax=Heterobasidion irregulare (strain TC 32-1) TaxID=747525 RepID=W4KJZ3_HETIT|nr:uncharacterized protein HETIRDRAFT_167592 [Heterobasidion irregulare TC 32-1]ETW86183.1 hypothetical protein HETIRDRAFT_167592 [Heterobasidion irregulare TC 32-1]
MLELADSNGDICDPRLSVSKSIISSPCGISTAAQAIRQVLSSHYRSQARSFSDGHRRHHTLGPLMGSSRYSNTLIS